MHARKAYPSKLGPSRSHQNNTRWFKTCSATQKKKKHSERSHAIATSAPSQAPCSDLETRAQEPPRISRPATPNRKHITPAQFTAQFVSTSWHAKERHGHAQGQEMRPPAIPIASPKQWWTLRAKCPPPKPTHKHTPKSQPSPPGLLQQVGNEVKPTYETDFEPASSRDRRADVPAYTPAIPRKSTQRTPAPKTFDTDCPDLSSNARKTSHIHPPTNTHKHPQTHTIYSDHKTMRRSNDYAVCPVGLPHFAIHVLKPNTTSTGPGMEKKCYVPLPPMYETELARRTTPCRPPATPPSSCYGEAKRGYSAEGCGKHATDMNTARGPWFPPVCRRVLHSPRVPPRNIYTQAVVHRVQAKLSFPLGRWKTRPGVSRKPCSLPSMRKSTPRRT